MKNTQTFETAEEILHAFNQARSAGDKSPYFGSGNAQLRVNFNDTR